MRLTAVGEAAGPFYLLLSPAASPFFSKNILKENRLDSEMSDRAGFVNLLVFNNLFDTCINL